MMRIIKHTIGEDMPICTLESCKRPKKI